MCMTVIKEVRQEIWKALFKMYMADDNNIYRWIYGKAFTLEDPIYAPSKEKRKLDPTNTCVYK